MSAIIVFGRIAFDSCVYKARANPTTCAVGETEYFTKKKSTA